MSVEPFRALSENMALRLSNFDMMAYVDQGVVDVVVFIITVGARVL